MNSQNATRGVGISPAGPDAAGMFPGHALLQHEPPGYALRHALQVIGQKEPAVRAWAFVANAATLPSSDGKEGPLAGIPFGTKDVIDVAGMPTRCGSPASDAAAAPFHAACVDQLVSAGAVPIGKTVTAEYAFRHPGPTCNPLRPSHTPGGSSSGSAAAVAAGMVPLSLSTQTGGSIIRPAAYCGVPGFKPSYGLVSRAGLQLTSESLDTIGWHASDMDWMTRCAEVLLPRPEIVKPAVLEGARIAVIDFSPEAELDHDGRHAMDIAMQALQRAGASCQSHDAVKPLMLLARAHAAIMKYEFARNLGPVARLRAGQLTPSLIKNVEEGWNTPHSLYLDMCAVQHGLRTEWETMSGGADFILTPAAAGAAPAGHEFTGTPAFNKCWTVLGWPCLHLPVAYNNDGLPVGVQLVGPWKQDFSVLSFGSQFERTLGLTRRGRHSKAVAQGHRPG